MALIGAEDRYLLWLSGIENLGGRRVLPLLERFGSAEAVCNASRDELKNCGLNEQHINSVLQHNRTELTDEYARGLDTAGVNLVTINNSTYPALLREIFDPPVCLYVLGELPGDDAPKVSVIGSRRCSEYGLTVSRRMAKDLAANGVVVVSGMAKGIDSSAHIGALEGSGKTVAVLGCGVDVCYPAENKLLRERIINNGCVISEYPLKTPPMAYHFPARNRIISGLSLATVVIEAAERSGTLITAGQALEQGRDVFAVPGNVTSKLSRGTNALIKQGAALVEGSVDILNLLDIPHGGDVKQATSGKTDLKPEERVVYDMIGDEPVSVTDIMQKSGSQAQTVQYILTMLEIYGLVEKLSGTRYIRR